MTVRDIFELRRQGRIEEAYKAIRPMYAAHKGKYTSLCMFWTASDIFKLRLEQERVNDAYLIFQALKHVLPYINDSDGKAMAFMQYAARRLAKVRKSEEEITEAPQPITQELTEMSQLTSVEISAVSVSEKNDPSDSRNVYLEDNDNACKDSDGEESRLEGSQDVRLDKEFYSGHLVVGLDEGIIDRPYDKITAPQSKVLDYIKANEGCSVPNITAATGIPAKNVERHISFLTAKGLIEHRGSKKSGGYFMTNP